MIKIFDVSNIVYAGSSTKYGKTLSYNGIPTGGLTQLLYRLLVCTRSNITPVLCFDSPTNARDILPEYKASRPSRPEIRFQTDLAYEVLSSTMPNVFKVPNMEADSIAFNLIETNLPLIKDQYFALVSDDKDWSHNICSERVELQGATENGVSINYENFCDVLSTENGKVELNCISAYKVFFGDPSDNIGRLKVVGLESIGDGPVAQRRRLFEIFKVFCKKNKINPRNKESISIFLDNVPLDETMTQSMLSRADVIYPKKADDPNKFRIDINNKFTVNQIEKLMQMTGQKRMCEKAHIRFNPDLGPFQDELRERYNLKYKFNQSGKIERLMYEQSTHEFEDINKEGFKLG